MIAVHIWGGSNVSLSGSWDSWASYFLSILILLEILTLPLHPHFLLASLLLPPSPPHTYTHTYTHGVCLVHTHTRLHALAALTFPLSFPHSHFHTDIWSSQTGACVRPCACVRVCLRACWGGYRVCTRLGNTCEEKEGDGRMTTRECKRRKEKRRRGDLDRGKGKRDGWRPLMQHGG